MNVSFDFDGTLHRDGHPLWPSLALLRWHDQSGHRVVIVTTRTESHEDPEWWNVHEPDRVTISAFLSRYGLPVGSVFFTEHRPKVDTLLRHEIELHYDDDPEEVTAAEAAGVQSVLLNGVSFHV
jgi:acid phosphatase class B